MLYNRFRRWSENGVFERIFGELAKPQDGAGNVLMIDATYLKAHRTAYSLEKGRRAKADRADQRRPEYETAYPVRQTWATCVSTPDGRSGQRLQRRRCSSQGVTKGLIPDWGSRIR